MTGKAGVTGTLFSSFIIANIRISNTATLWPRSLYSNYQIGSLSRFNGANGCDQRTVHLAYNQ